MKNFLSKFTGKSIGIIEFESDFSGKYLLCIRFQRVNLFIQEINALDERRSKPFFFNAYDTLNVFLFRYEFAKVFYITKDFDDSINRSVQEWLCDAQHPSMTDRTPYRTAQHISSSLIGWQNAVHDHNDNRTRMIGDDLEGYIFLWISAILRLRYIGSILDNRIEQICLEICLLILYDRSKTLKSAARIDVFMGKEVILTILGAVILRKDEIPDFEESITIASYTAGRTATATFRSEINIYLRIRTAWPRADLPEIIFQRDNMIRGKTRLLQPNLLCFVIVWIDGYPKLLFGQFDDFGQKLPCPRNRFFLEIVSKGEVSKHLKKCLMPRCTSDVFDISCTHTALTGNDAMARRLYLTGKKGLEGCHASTDQKQRRVILRDKRIAWQTKMSLLLCKKIKICFPQFFSCHIFQFNRPPSINSCAKYSTFHRKNILHQTFNQFHGLFL